MKTSNKIYRKFVPELKLSSEHDNSLRLMIELPLPDGYKVKGEISTRKKEDENPLDRVYEINVVKDKDVIHFEPYRDEVIIQRNFDPALESGAKVIVKVSGRELVGVNVDNQMGKGEDYSNNDENEESFSSSVNFHEADPTQGENKPRTSGSGSEPRPVTK